MTGLRRPLRIGICCFPTVGGSGIVATELGLALARRGHDVHLIATAPPFRLEAGSDEPSDRALDATGASPPRSSTPRLQFHPVRALSYPLFDDAHDPYPVALASRIVDVSRQAPLDLLHVHYAVPHATSAFLAREVLRSSGQPLPRLVVTLHGTDITLVGSDASYLPVTRFAIESCDGVTTPSAWLRDETWARLGVARTRPIAVIPNFVDTALYRPRDASEPSAPSDSSSLPSLAGSPLESAASEGARPLVLLHGSNFRPLKRSDDCVRVLAAVRRERPAVLLLVGEGPERAAVEALARSLGLAHAVASLGVRADLAALLRRADAFLLPSVTESFGLAALEALAAGVPVVTTRTGGLPEVVLDGETGFLHAVGDVEAMAASVLRLADATLHARMARAARADVLARFRREPIVDEWERYYEEVLARR